MSSYLVHPASLVAQERAPCALHLPPAPGHVAVCVDRGNWGVYEEGDPLTICGGLTEPANRAANPPAALPHLRITTTVDDNPPQVLLDESLLSGGRCVNTVSGPPFGMGTARAEVIQSDGVSPRFSPTTFVSVPRASALDGPLPAPCSGIAETIGYPNHMQRLMLGVGDCVMLALGAGYPGYVWTATVTGPPILQAQEDALLPTGAQAIYQATRLGMTLLTIRGELWCPPGGPPCPAPVAGASVLVTVE
jgi:hypothetical protein